MVTRKTKKKEGVGAETTLPLELPRDTRAQGLESIVGQSRALGVLNSLLQTGRLSNAYLFDGPWGVGKTRTALAFATALLCSAPTPEGRACGDCAGCGRASRLQHPDLRFLFPVSGEESSLDGTISEILEAMREDPLHLFTYEKAASIRISLTRELLRELPFKPYEADRRVVVVRDADRMRGDQYSAMLKSLEEPGQSTVWVLTTSRVNRLPATIRSRCLNIRFGPLSEEEIRDFLVAEVAVPEERARLLAAISAGSLGRALLWRDEDIATARDEALEMLRPALSGDIGGILAESSKISRGLNREKIRRVLEFQILWLRDVLRLRYGTAAQHLANRDRLSDLEKSAARVGVGEIKRRLAILEEIGRAIEGNVNAEIAFFSGMSRIGGKISEQTDDWPAHRLVSNRAAV